MRQTESAVENLLNITYVALLDLSQHIAEDDKGFCSYHFTRDIHAVRIHQFFVREQLSGWMCPARQLLLEWVFLRLIIGGCLIFSAEALIALIAPEDVLVEAAFLSIGGQVISLISRVLPPLFAPLALDLIHEGDQGLPNVVEHLVLKILDLKFLETRE